MQINPVKSLNFKAYIPVKYYARSESDGRFHRIVTNDYMRKCQSFVVRNLNQTAKNQRNDKFIEFYRSIDSDYRNNPIVTSVYDNKSSVVYLVSADDAVNIKNLAKPIGRAKSEALSAIGKAKSFESKEASKDYFKQAKYYLEHYAQRLKSQEGDNYTLRVYFEPKYSKKDHILKGFEYYGSRLTIDDIN